MARAVFREEPIAVNEAEAADVAALRRLIEGHDAGSLRIGVAEGEQMALPPPVVSFLSRGLAALAADRVVSVRSMSRQLTLDEVEALAEIPRDEIVRLLDEGAAPSSTIDGARYVQYDDAITLRRRQEAVRRAALDFLADQGQEIGPLLERDPHHSEIDDAPPLTARVAD